jgi:hypothetical protein
VLVACLPAEWIREDDERGESSQGEAKIPRRPEAMTARKRQRATPGRVAERGC